MMTAEIAAVLGAAHRSGAWWRCRCPLHDSHGATLALRDGDRGLIVKCHAGCPRTDILAELRQRRLIGGASAFKNSYRLFARLADTPDDPARRSAAAQHIWAAAKDADGTPVVRYLAGRGIIITPPPSLRYTPTLRRSDGTYGPGLIARIDDIDGEQIGISRTWLDRDTDGRWLRRDRKMLGRAAGGAVRLASAAETLLIGEGVETSLAAMQATAQPSWAALSTSGLISLVLPPIVRTVIIVADHDASGAGERAARTAAARWCREGRQVSIWMSLRSGEDANDLLLAAATAREARHAL